MQVNAFKAKSLNEVKKFFTLCNNLKEDLSRIEESSFTSKGKRIEIILELASAFTNLLQIGSFGTRTKGGLKTNNFFFLGPNAALFEQIKHAYEELAEMALGGNLVGKIKNKWLKTLCEKLLPFPEKLIQNMSEDRNIVDFAGFLDVLRLKKYSQKGSRLGSSDASGADDLRDYGSDMEFLFKVLKVFESAVGKDVGFKKKLFLVFERVLNAAYLELNTASSDGKGSPETAKLFSQLKTLLMISHYALLKQFKDNGKSADKSTNEFIKLLAFSNIVMPPHDIPPLKSRSSKELEEFIASVNQVELPNKNQLNYRQDVLDVKNGLPEDELVDLLFEKRKLFREFMSSGSHLFLERFSQGFNANEFGMNFADFSKKYEVAVRASKDVLNAREKQKVVAKAVNRVSRPNANSYSEPNVIVTSHGTDHFSSSIHNSVPVSNGMPSVKSKIPQQKNVSPGAFPSSSSGSKARVVPKKVTFSTANDPISSASSVPSTSSASSVPSTSSASSVPSTSSASSVPSTQVSGGSVLNVNNGVFKEKKQNNDSYSIDIDDLNKLIDGVEKSIDDLSVDDTVFQISMLNNEGVVQDRHEHIDQIASKMANDLQKIGGMHVVLRSHRAPIVVVAFSDAEVERKQVEIDSMFKGKHTVNEVGIANKFVIPVNYLLTYGLNKQIKNLELFLLQRLKSLQFLPKSDNVSSRDFIFHAEKALARLRTIELKREMKLQKYERLFKQLNNHGIFDPERDVSRMLYLNTDTPQLKDVSDKGKLLAKPISKDDKNELYKDFLDKMNVNFNKMSSKEMFVKNGDQKVNLSKEITDLFVRKKNIVIDKRNSSEALRDIEDLSGDVRNLAKVLEIMTKRLRKSMNQVSKPPVAKVKLDDFITGLLPQLSVLVDLQDKILFCAHYSRSAPPFFSRAKLEGMPVAKLALKNMSVLSNALAKIPLMFAKMQVSPDKVGEQLYASVIALCEKLPSCIDANNPKSFNLLKASVVKELYDVCSVNENSKESKIHSISEELKAKSSINKPVLISDMSVEHFAYIHKKDRKLLTGKTLYQRSNGGAKISKSMVNNFTVLPFFDLVCNKKDLRKLSNNHMYDDMIKGLQDSFDAKLRQESLDKDAQGQVPSFDYSSPSRVMLDEPRQSFVSNESDFDSLVLYDGPSAYPEMHFYDANAMQRINERDKEATAQRIPSPDHKAQGNVAERSNTEKLLSKRNNTEKHRRVSI